MQHRDGDRSARRNGLRYREERVVFAVIGMRYRYILGYVWEYLGMQVLLGEAAPGPIVKQGMDKVLWGTSTVCYG